MKRSTSSCRITSCNDSREQSHPPTSFVSVRDADPSPRDLDDHRGRTALQALLQLGACVHGEGERFMDPVRAAHRIVGRAIGVRATAAHADVNLTAQLRLDVADQGKRIVARGARCPRSSPPSCRTSACRRSRRPRRRPTPKRPDRQARRKRTDCRRARRPRREPSIGRRLHPQTPADRYGNRGARTPRVLEYAPLLMRRGACSHRLVLSAAIGIGDAADPIESLI